MAYVTDSGAAEVTAASAIALLIIIRHRSNLARVRAGTERRLRLRETRQ